MGLRYWSVSFMMFLLTAGCAGTVPKGPDIQTDSVVVGCVENPVIAPDGFGYYENSRAMPEWRLTKLRLRDVESQDVIDLFLRRNGCFSTAVDSGTYAFEHFVKGSKYYRHDKEFYIGQVNVPPGKLVNLGTFHLEVFNVEFYRWAKGDYPIIAGFKGDKRFDQVSGDGCFELPLEDFKDRNPEVFEMYRERVVEWKQINSSQYSVISGNPEADSPQGPQSLMPRQASGPEQTIVRR